MQLIDIWNCHGGRNKQSFQPSNNYQLRLFAQSTLTLPTYKINLYVFATDSGHKLCPDSPQLVFNQVAYSTLNCEVLGAHE